MTDASILIVDDDRPILRMLARTLAAEGYAAVSAADGGAALAAVERSVPDLVVLDVAMPGVDGLAVTRRLRAKGLAVPILLLTARDAVADRVAVLLSAPAPADVAAYLQRALPAAGFRVGAPADTFTFTRGGWSGSFTTSAGSSAILLRPA